MKWNDPVDPDSTLNFILMMLTFATAGLGVIMFIWIVKKLLVE